MDYKRGDRVRLIKDCGNLRQGVVGAVLNPFVGASIYGSYMSVLWDGYPSPLLVYLSNCVSEVPLTPLEVQVRAYIRSELPNV